MSSAKMRYTIAAMIVVWLVAMGLMMFSPSVRARYFAWRLGRAETEALQRYYASRLAVRADHALAQSAELLRHPEPRVRCLTVDVVGQARAPGAAELLLDALRDRDSEVRDAAALALGKRAMPALIGQLSELATCDDENVAGAAVFALQRAACPESVDVIIKVLKHTPSAAVRVQAIESLGLLGIQRARPIIQGMLTDPRTVPTPPANERAIWRALAAQRNRSDLPSLATVASPDHREGTVADYAAKALRWIDRESASTSRATTRPSMSSSEPACSQAGRSARDRAGAD